jgi:hypothetical protein
MPATTEQLDARIASFERMVAQLAEIVADSFGRAVLLGRPPQPRPIRLVKGADDARG